MAEKDLFGSEACVLKKHFLRWPGGKNWLVSELCFLISKINFNNYHEPFLGGGSVFFSLGTRKKSFLSDYNFDLINAYSQVKDSPLEIMELLREYPQNKDFYYELRSSELDCKIKSAARFIYLNKTSFNGIYRVNKNGKFNVPYGQRSFNLGVFEQLLLSCSDQLKHACLFSASFEKSIENVRDGDLVYLDPPYTISHSNNGFIKYNEKLFSIVDQFRLRDLIEQVRNKGAYYILSNAHHPDVKKIFDKFNDNVLTLKRQSVVSGKKSGRGLYKEYLFTNIK